MLIFRNNRFFTLYFHNYFRLYSHTHRLSTLQTTNGNKISNDNIKDDISSFNESSDSLNEEKKSSIILRKPVSSTFIRDVLLPHIEHTVTFDSHKIPPHLLIQLAIAYSKLPHFLIQKEVADRIIDTFIYRISDYGPSDCVQILNTSLQIQGVRNTNIYEATINRLKAPHIQCELNTLNKLGIARTLSKAINQLRHLTGQEENLENNDLILQNQNMFAPSPGFYNIEQDLIHPSLLKPWTFVQKSIQKSNATKAMEFIAKYASDFIIPTLISELESHDPPELSAILGTIADNSIRDNTKSDFPIIAILMSIIMKKYPQTSLLHNIANITSLCKLRILHPSYLDMVKDCLIDKYKSRNLYHKHLARVIWVFCRYGKLNLILPSLESQLHDNLSKFDSRDFARLAQSLPRDSEIIFKLAHKLSQVIFSMNSRDFVFYYIGCIYANVLSEDINEKCNVYLHDKNDKFDLVDINRLVSSVVRLKRNDLLELFPKQWSEIIKTIL